LLVADVPEVDLQSWPAAGVRPPGKAIVPVTIPGPDEVVTFPTLTATAPLATFSSSKAQDWALAPIA